jgi:signal transduction histidine kinase
VPLAAVKGLAQLASRQVDGLAVPEARQVAEALGRIDAASGRMAAMLDGLLDATRLEAGRTLDLDVQPTDLAAVAREAVAEQQRLSTRHRIMLDAGAEVLVGTWDAARLERVMGNLLSNAIKYSPEGGQVVVRLAREQDEQGDWAVLEVRDHGVGIPPADLPYVFERYRRGRNVEGRIAGSGIGLAGACQILQQHGGTLTAASDGEGRGSTFTLRLPLASRGAEPLPVAPTP